MISLQEENTETHRGDSPMFHEGRAWRDVSSRQGMPRMVGNPQDPGEGPDTGTPSQILEGTDPQFWLF